MEEADKVPEPNNDGVLAMLLIAVLFGGIAVIVAALAADVRRWRRRRLSDFLNGIRYSDRIYREDVRCRNGKVYRLVPNGTDGDGVIDKWGRYHETHSWTTYKKIEVSYEDVPLTHNDWNDDPASPWHSQLPWKYRSR